MRIARALIDGQPRIVVDDGSGPRLAPADHPDDALAALRSVDRASWQTVDAASLSLLAPVAGAGKIIAVGLNYVEHIDETGFTPPARPLTFAKYATSLTGPTADVVMPTHLTEQVDFEVELALVIGRRCGGATPATLDDVAGYTIADDVSARDVQFADTQWTRGKSFDTFTPLGPWLVSPDEFDVHAGHRISTTVISNGVSEVLQDDTTASLIFDVPTLLAFVSDGVTLEAGDIVLTGTPSGAGAFRDPARYLGDGDVVVCAIEGLGELRNRIVARADARA